MNQEIDLSEAERIDTELDKDILSDHHLADGTIEWENRQLAITYRSTGTMGTQDDSPNVMINMIAGNTWENLIHSSGKFGESVSLGGSVSVTLQHGAIWELIIKDNGYRLERDHIQPEFTTRLYYSGDSLEEVLNKHFEGLEERQLIQQVETALEQIANWADTSESQDDSRTSVFTSPHHAQTAIKISLNLTRRNIIHTVAQSNNSPGLSQASLKYPGS